MVCLKVAGRDAGKTCVVVEDEKNGRVLIEGETRRRACNTLHLEPLGRSVAVKKDASHADVMKALGLEARASKARKPAQKPLPVRKVKERAPEAPKKVAKKAPAKKAEKKVEEKVEA